jgi:hypothetical protein
MTRLPFRWTLPLVAVCCAAPALAAGAEEPRRLLPEEAPVLVAPPGGLVRLPLPAAVRAACRPDLSDLRLLDREGREIPFLVDVAHIRTGPTPQTVDLTIVDAFREERRPDGAPPSRRESFVLETPDDLDTASLWTLVVDAPSPRNFVRRVEVTQDREAGEPAQLVTGRSLFRLGNAAETRTSLEVPGLRRGRFVITLEGEDDTYLSPRFHLERTVETTPPARLDVALSLRQRRQEPGKTILVLERPPGIVPERLRVASATPTFARPVTVYDVLPTGRRIVLGQGTVRRLDAEDAEPQLEIEMRPAQGTGLEVEVLDQDSPPLDAVEVGAVVREIALVFSLPTAGEPAATLLFGGGRIRAPRYDIAALAALADGPASSARLGDVTSNPAFDDRPLLGFAMRPGATLDLRVFAYRRPLVVPASPTGLARVRLDVADLAEARADLADLRIVDEQGRQWPYLLERDALTAAVPLGMTQAAREERQTRYGFTPRPSPLRLDGLEIDVDADFLDRPFTLIGTDARGSERPLAGGRLRRAAGSDEPLRIAFADTRVTALGLVIQNGDEAPLTITAGRALCPLSELYVAAPPGEYALLAGDSEAAPPQYEIAAMRGAVLAVPAVEVTSGPGGPNPAFSSGAATARRIAGGRLLPRLAVWTVLVLAVVVLTLLTLRVVRREGT